MTENSRGDLKFLWVGPAYDPSGHADELRGFLRAQEQAGHAPALNNVSWNSRKAEVSEEDAAMLLRQRRRARAQWPDIAIHTALPGGTPHVDGARNVARAMFETDRMPESWLDPLLRRDQVWVPCRHNFETFAGSGIPEHRLRIVGGTLDFDLFAPGAEPYPIGVEEGRAVFLTNFDFSARKGWDVLLRAWAAAFDADDPVCLVLKTGSFYRDDRWVAQRIHRFLAELGAVPGGLAPIHLLTDLLTAEQMPSLYAAADAYVLASRGEGWGRPYMEAQAMGLPVIASRWGGQREFLDEDTTWITDGRLVAVPTDCDLFNDLYVGHRWFEPDVDDLAAQMRDIAADWAAARARTAPARERLMGRFGAEATAERIRSVSGELVGRDAGPRRACLIRGRFGSTESLATVNDGLSGALEQAGWLIGLRSPEAEPESVPVPGVSHSWPHDFTPSTEGPSVVVLPWEYGAAPVEWVEQARREADRVWVPSAYVRDRHVASGMPPGIVEVVPNGVDVERFHPDGPVRQLPVQAGCVFLFVGGSIWRKGIDRLVVAWQAAFAPEEDVALVIKDFGTATSYRGQNARADLLRFAARRDIAPVLYLDEDVPAHQLPALYRAADVLVAPYRGEGFCMPALEALACGVPVIHTGTGPTAEFVAGDAGWALAARQVPLDEAGLPELAGEGHVQEPDLDSLVAVLRAAVDPQERARRGANARAAAQRHTWDAAAEAAARSLQTLVAEDLAPARCADPERVELPLDRMVVAYAPDWSRPAGWQKTICGWSDIFEDTDPLTLAIICGELDADRVVEWIHDALTAAGHEPQAVPDLLLCQPGITLADVLVRADAVLLGEGDVARPELVRRAPRVIRGDAGSLRSLRRELDVPERDDQVLALASDHR